MAKEALLKIVEAEEVADQMLKKAKEDARNLVSQAEANSKISFDEAISKARAECSRLKEKAEDEVRPELDSIQNECDAKCTTIENVSKDKFNEAKKLLIERIVK